MWREGGRVVCAEMVDELWDILKSQPDVGVAIVDVAGGVHFANPQLHRLYGWSGGEVAGRTIAELEGPEFAAEWLQVIQQVASSRTKTPVVVRHVRGGRYTETVLWPLPQKEAPRPCVLITTRQGDPSNTPEEWPVFESQLVHLGPLDVLTPRELEVMILIGHGTPLKVIASELGLSQRTIERYRTAIAQKLDLDSLAEIAGLVHLAGLTIHHARLPRVRKRPGS